MFEKKFVWEDTSKRNSGKRKSQDARKNKSANFCIDDLHDDRCTLLKNARYIPRKSPWTQFISEDVLSIWSRTRGALTFHWKSAEGSLKNHFCGQGFIVPSGVLNIRPSRLRRGARTLVVMLPFLYEAMPAFMYICGMVSFSRSFRVTLGIFGFFGVLAVFVSSVVPLEDAERTVVGGRAEVLTVWRTLIDVSVLGIACVLISDVSERRELSEFMSYAGIIIMLWLISMYCR